jgi:ribosomal protein S19
MEEKGLLIDIASDRCHDLSGIEPVKDWKRERMVIHHLLGVLFRVHRKRHHLGPDLFEPLNVSLKVS